MTLRVGLDLASISEVQRSVAVFGDAYLRRVYTPHELANAAVDGGVDASRLAARFAAKEAVLKALGPRDDALPWTDIEVLSADGPPTVALHGAAAALAEREGVSGLVLSLTHEAGTAAAVVIGIVEQRRSATEGEDRGV